MSDRHQKITEFPTGTGIERPRLFIIAQGSTVGEYNNWYSTKAVKLRKVSEESEQEQSSNSIQCWLNLSDKYPPLNLFAVKNTHEHRAKSLTGKSGMPPHTRDVIDRDHLLRSSLRTCRHLISNNPLTSGGFNVLDYLIIPSQFLTRDDIKECRAESLKYGPKVFWEPWWVGTSLKEEIRWDFEIFYPTIKENPDIRLEWYTTHIPNEEFRVISGRIRHVQGITWPCTIGQCVIERTVYLIDEQSVEMYWGSLRSKDKWPSPYSLDPNNFTGKWYSHVVRAKTEVIQIKDGSGNVLWSSVPMRRWRILESLFHPGHKD